MGSPEKHFSVIVPLLNEEGSLETLFERIAAVLGELADPRGFEVIFVDDGSRDEGPNILARLAADHEQVVVITFRRNFGKAAALDAGFAHARGEVVVTMDADLQDVPEELPFLIEKLDEGFDCVSGWKKVRHDPLGKTLPSRLFNAAVRAVSGLKLHDFNCGFKAYRAEALRGLRLYGEMHRYIPVLLHWRGFRVNELPVEHAPRVSGQSKYGWERFAKGFFDLLTVVMNTRYRARPLHLFGIPGLALAGLGGLILSYLTALWFLELGPIGGRPLLFLGLLLMTVGVQLVSTGLLGELITRGQHSADEYYLIKQVCSREQPAGTTPQDAQNGSLGAA